MWDAESGSPILTLKGHTDTVRSVAVSSDGKRVASGGRDNMVRIWNVAFSSR